MSAMRQRKARSSRNLRPLRARPGLRRPCDAAGGYQRCRQCGEPAEKGRLCDGCWVRRGTAMLEGLDGADLLGRVVDHGSRLAQELRK